MITQEQLKQLDESLGSSLDDAGHSGDDAPNGHNLLGALRAIQRLGEDMDEYGVAYSDLNDEKQAEMDDAVEDLRYHLKKLANIFGSDLVGADDTLELPNGNSVDLPGAATSASGGGLPDDPRAGAAQSDKSGA